MKIDKIVKAKCLLNNRKSKMLKVYLPVEAVSELNLHPGTELLLGLTVSSREKEKEWPEAYTDAKFLKRHKGVFQNFKGGGRTQEDKPVATTDLVKEARRKNVDQGGR